MRAAVMEEFMGGTEAMTLMRARVAVASDG